MKTRQRRYIIIIFLQLKILHIDFIFKKWILRIVYILSQVSRNTENKGLGGGRGERGGGGRGERVAHCCVLRVQE